MPDSVDTIAELLRQNLDTFTRAERQLAGALLADYPMSGVGSITRVAENAGVSTPTVVRMLRKLGLTGFPEFQSRLHREVGDIISTPVTKHESWAREAPAGHIINRFAEAVTSNISQSLAQMETRDFDACADLLADGGRAIYVAGGRITRAIADYFFLHMQVVRPDVTLIQSVSNAWPHYLLNVKEDDVLVVFDVRRYENATRRLVEMARESGATVILFTDQWRSPIAPLSDHVLSSRIEVPSAWDSAVVLMLLAEMLLAAVQERTWHQTRARMETLEEMFDRTRFFRKFT
ncbi:MAG: MurR/RpiR family transcriptional regulator [Paracoccaceae bacterium]